MFVVFFVVFEEDLGEFIGCYFDFIVGILMGGIIVFGLGLGRIVKELFEFYECCGLIIFGQIVEEIKKFGKLWQLWCSFIVKGWYIVWLKYNVDVFVEEIRFVLGDECIGQLKIRLVVLVWDVDFCSFYIYKIVYYMCLQIDFCKMVLDVVMVIVVVLIYFKWYCMVDDVGLIDGGIWVNNFMVFVVVEVIIFLGWYFLDLCILSLGCLDEVYMLFESVGVVSFGFKIFNFYVDGQLYGVFGMVKFLIGYGYDGECIY